MKRNKLISDFVFVDKFGAFKFIYDFYGEIDGVFEFDRLLEFYTVGNIDDNINDNEDYED